MEKMFHPKLLSLINQNSIIPFNKLTLDTLFKISSRALENMGENFKETSNINIEYEDKETVSSPLSPSPSSRT